MSHSSKKLLKALTIIVGGVRNSIGTSSLETITIEDGTGPVTTDRDVDND